MSPLVTTCPTCQRRLVVRDHALAGQIVLCPGCQSMVALPTLPGAAAGPAAGSLPTGPAGVSPDSQLTDPSTLLGGAAPPSGATIARTVRAGSGPADGSAASQITQPVPIPPPPPDGETAGRERGARFRTDGPPPGMTVPGEAAPPEADVAESSDAPPAPSAADPGATERTAPVGGLWKHGLLLGTVALLGVVLAVVVCMILALEPRTEVAASGPDPTVASPPDPVPAGPETLPDDGPTVDPPGRPDPAGDVIPPGDVSVTEAGPPPAADVASPATPAPATPEVKPPAAAIAPAPPAAGMSLPAEMAGIDPETGEPRIPTVDPTDARTGTALSAALDRFGPLLGGPPASDAGSSRASSAPGVDGTGDLASPPAAGPEPTVERPPPPPGAWPTDPDAAWEEPIAGLKLAAMPVPAFLRLVEGIAHVPITLEAETAVGLRQTAPPTVTLAAEATTVGAALTEALGPLDLGVIRGPAGWTVSSAAPGLPPMTVRLPAGDLAGGGGPGVTPIDGLARQFVRPDLWVRPSPPGGGAPGGTPPAGPSVELEGAELVVAAPRRVAIEVATFLDRVRRARGLVPSGRIPEPATRPVRVAADDRETLGRSVFANFSRPTPLAEVLARFRSETGTEFLIDGVGLAGVGYTPDAPVTVVIESEPLPLALDRLLSPRGLDWRVLDVGLIEVRPLGGTPSPVTTWVPLGRPVSPTVAETRAGVAQARHAAAIRYDALGGVGGFWVRAAGEDLLAVAAILAPEEAAPIETAADGPTAELSR